MCVALAGGVAAPDVSGLVFAAASAELIGAAVGVAAVGCIDWQAPAVGPAAGLAVGPAVEPPAGPAAVGTS